MSSHDWSRAAAKAIRMEVLNHWNGAHLIPAEFVIEAILLEHVPSAGAAVKLDAKALAERIAALRNDGWRVAVHNDYRMNGDLYTFWLFTKGNHCVKGEGRTDAEALAIIEQELTRPLPPADAKEQP